MSRIHILGIIFILLGLCNLATADENTIFITYGADASTLEGDDDYKQVIFFALPETLTDSVYLRLFDADVGGKLDAPYGEWDTKTRYRLFGGAGSYTAKTIRSAFPDADDLVTGVLIADETVGEDEFRDHKWYTFAAISPSQGESVKGRNIFKLLVEGLSGNDGNIFEVELSRSSKRNAAPDGLKVFTYCPTIRLPSLGVFAELRFYVPKDNTEIIVHNYDLAAANVGIDTKFRSGLTVTPSAQGQWMENKVVLEPNEVGQNVALTFNGGYEMPNDATFYFTTDKEIALPIELPILIFKPNNRPVPEVKLNPLSDCGTIVFDGSGSWDKDGHELDFFWNFGDGSSAKGSRVVHQYDNPGTYEAELIVSDKSGLVGNASIKRVSVLVNQPPCAVPAADKVTVPGAMVNFDGSGSYDSDGRIKRYVWTLGDGTRAEGIQIQHSYDKPGNYEVVLRVEDDSNSPCNFGSEVMEVLVNAPPVVRIGEDHIISPNQDITLSGANSYDSDGEISQYYWEFGDGATGSQMMVTHAYKNPGKYRVRLTITDDTDVSNNQAFDEITIVVNDPPDAVAKSDRPVVATNEDVLFDGLKSVDRDGKIIEYLWDFGDGLKGEGSTVKHAYVRPGVYTTKMTIRDNSTTNSDTDQDEVTTIVNYPPVANAGPDQWVTSSVVQFDGTRSRDEDNEIIAYDWDFGDGAHGSGVTPSHVYGNPGTYNVMLTITDASGTSTSKNSCPMQVIINYAPIADAGQSLIGAPGETIFFDGSLSIDPDGEIKSYHWDFGDGHSGEGEKVQHVYEKSGTYTVTLTVRDNTMHENAVSHDGTTVFINLQPVAIAGADVLAAPGDKIWFDGTESYDRDGKILTYQWDFSDGLERSSKAKMFRTFDSPGIYTAILTIVDNSGSLNAQNQDQVLIHINNRPIAKPGDDIHSCDLTIPFDGSASVDADGNPLTYKWDFGDGSPPSFGVKVLHTYREPGTFPVILTVDDGTSLSNSNHTSSLVVRINQAPIANAGENRTVCAGDVVLFSGAASVDPEGGLMRYHWDFGDGSTDVGVNPTKKYINGGVYKVVLTVQDDSGLPCNTSVDEIVVRVAESPVADAGEDKKVCANTEVRFDGTKSRDFDGLVNRYFWDFGDGTTKDGATPTHVFREPGEYIVSLTITGDQVGECDNTDTDDLIVTVYDAPVATFSAPPAAAVNSAIEFDASESSAGGAKITSYKWDFGDETTGNDKKIKHIYKTPGKYFVALNIETDSETSCNTTSTRSLIIINDTPVAEAGPDQLVGVIQIVIFDGSGSSDSDGSIASYQWDFGDGSTGKGVQTRHNYKEPGEYVVTLRVTDDTNLENNWATDKLTVTVNAAPVPVIEMPDWVCVGQEVEFDGGKSHDPDGKRASFHWDFGDGAAVNGSKVTHVYITPGQYNVILSVNDGREVSNSRAETSKMIRVNHPPMVDAGPDRLICPNQEITFDASGSFDHDGTITRYLWNFGDGDRAEGKIVKHSYTDPGLFRAELTISDNSATDCGVVTDLVEVRVNAPPVANAGADREAFVGGAHDAVAFDGTQSSDPDGNPLTYFWDFGDGATAEGPIVSHAYKAPGTYIVKMRVRDDTGLPCGEAWAKATIKVRYREAALR